MRHCADIHRRSAVDRWSLIGFWQNVSRFDSKIAKIQKRWSTPGFAVPICRGAIRDASDEHQNFHFFHTFSSFLVKLMKCAVVRWCQKCDEMHGLVKVPRQDGAKMQNFLKSAVVR